MILYGYFEKLVVGNRRIVTGWSLCAFYNEITCNSSFLHTECNLYQKPEESFLSLKSGTAVQCSEQCQVAHISFVPSPK